MGDVVVLLSEGEESVVELLSEEEEEGPPPLKRRLCLPDFKDGVEAEEPPLVAPASALLSKPASPLASPHRALLPYDDVDGAGAGAAPTTDLACLCGDADCTASHDLVALQCFHFLSKACLRRSILAAIDAQRLKCTCLVPGCEQRLEEYEVKSVLGEPEFVKWLDTALLVATGDNPNIVKCPKEGCGLLIEVVPPPVFAGARAAAGGSKSPRKRRRASAVEIIKDSGKTSILRPIERDTDGKPLSLAALEHRDAFRMRCSACGSNFCTGCMEMPYHLGKTCEEFKAYTAASKCRFCATEMEAGAKPKRRKSRLADVCDADECQDRAKLSCVKKLPCGHPCRGVKGEKSCLGCLTAGCEYAVVTGKDVAGAGAGAAAPPAIDGDDFCNICWTEDLRSAPTLLLPCGHAFHVHCCIAKLSARWASARITFSFLQCPLCKEDMVHPLLGKHVNPMLKLKATVEEMALKRLSFENMTKAKQLVDRSSPFYQKPKLFAMSVFVYYPCFKCKKPYFAGRRQCQNAVANEEDINDKLEHLVCGGCSVPPAGVSTCPKHGTAGLEYKCRFCCSPATWLCWGTTRFCTPCHDKQMRGTYLTRMPESAFPKCPGAKKCPLKVSHPPNGTEFCLGCSYCRGNGTEF